MESSVTEDAILVPEKLTSVLVPPLPTVFAWIRIVSRMAGPSLVVVAINVNPLSVRVF